MGDSVEHQFSDASEEGDNLEGGDPINREQVRGVVIGGEGREGEGTNQQAEVELGGRPSDEWYRPLNGSRRWRIAVDAPERQGGATELLPQSPNVQNERAIQELFRLRQRAGATAYGRSTIQARDPPIAALDGIGANRGSGIRPNVGIYLDDVIITFGRFEGRDGNLPTTSPSLSNIQAGGDAEEEEEEEEEEDDRD